MCLQDGTFEAALARWDPLVRKRRDVSTVDCRVCRTQGIPGSSVAGFPFQATTTKAIDPRAGPLVPWFLLVASRGSTEGILKVFRWNFF